MRTTRSLTISHIIRLGGSSRPPDADPPGRPLPHVDRRNNTRLWKHYLPRTTVAGGNDGYYITCVSIRLLKSGKPFSTSSHWQRLLLLLPFLHLDKLWFTWCVHQCRDPRSTRRARKKLVTKDLNHYDNLDFMSFEFVIFKYFFF